MAHYAYDEFDADGHDIIHHTSIATRMIQQSQQLSVAPRHQHSSRMQPQRQLRQPTPRLMLTPFAHDPATQPQVFHGQQMVTQQYYHPNAQPRQEVSTYQSHASSSLLPYRPNEAAQKKSHRSRREPKPTDHARAISGPAEGEGIHSTGPVVACSSARRRYPGPGDPDWGDIDLSHNADSCGHGGEEDPSTSAVSSYSEAVTEFTSRFREGIYGSKNELVQALERRAASHVLDPRNFDSFGASARSKLSSSDSALAYPAVPQEAYTSIIRETAFTTAGEFGLQQHDMMVLNLILLCCRGLCPVRYQWTIGEKGYDCYGNNHFIPHSEIDMVLAGRRPRGPYVWVRNIRLWGMSKDLLKWSKVLEIEGGKSGFFNMFRSRARAKEAARHVWPEGYFK